MSEEFNEQQITEIADQIIDILKLCLQNKSTWKNDKQGMVKIIKDNFNTFYEKYPRICRIITSADDISPLITMLRTFSQVQAGKLSFKAANDMMSSQINSQYVDPVLNSDKLKKEREEKQKVVELN
jgi:hypothetical protein